MSVVRSTSGSVAVQVVTTSTQLQSAYDVRFAVFVDEQKVPVEEELDILDTDPTTTHVLAVDSETHEVLGTARLLPDSENASHFHIGRVAVVIEARGRGVGAVLMNAVEQIARKSVAGTIELELSAQVTAAPFYVKLGYSKANDYEYLDAGIPHIDMKKTLS